jgi:hypothetical protein
MMNGLQEHELGSALPELEGIGELEGELELGELGEFGELGELESESELEQEQFFGQLAALAQRASSSPTLRRLGSEAARAALQSLGEGELEGELEGESGRDNLYSPIRRAYPDALMEHMAHRASLAETEQEAAEAFLPLIPLLATKLAPLAIKALPGIGRAASKLAPKVFQGIMRVAPQLTRGVGRIARTLHRNPQSRALIRTIPRIARQTTADLARQVARGRPITPRGALQSLARQTARTLSNPRSCVQAYRRGKALDRAGHRLLLPTSSTPALTAATQTAPRGFKRVCSQCGC